jgi:anti-sigma factor RsiW
VTHPTELALAMLADDALEAHDAVEVEQHLAGCDRCAAHVAALREESQALEAALAYDPASVSVRSSSSRPASVRW